LVAIRIALALFAVYVLWGSNFVALKVGLETLPPFALLAVRWLVAGGILFALSAGPGRRADPLGPRQWIAGLVVGFFLIGGGNGLVTYGEQFESSAMTALLTAGSPIWSTLLGMAFFRQHVGWPTWCGLALGLGGLAVLIHPSHGGAGSWAGVVAILLGGVMWAVGSALALSLPLPKRPLVAVALQMLGGAASLAVATVLSGETRAFAHIALTPQFLWTFAWLVTCAGLVGYIAFNWLLQNTSLSLASTYAYVNPIVAVFMGSYLLHEQITFAMVLGAAIIVCGVALIIGDRPESTPRVLALESTRVECAPLPEAARR
jgi:drug/metabolite transporter (DMT)-like permease